MVNISLSKVQSNSYKDISKSIEMSLNSIGYKIDPESKSVVIKPNLCYYWDYTTGQTTHPYVVSATIDWIRRNTNKDITIYIAESDASAMKTKYAFKMLGYEKIALEKNVTLFNLSVGDIIKKETLVHGNKIELPINKLLLESDIIINIPTIKSHREIGFTCALKNMFGVISKERKYSYHKNLSQTIVAINNIVRSNLVIVDGIYVNGKYPKKMNLVIAGDDPLVIDMLTAEIMGYKPNQIAYLKLAISEKLGGTGPFNLTENSVTLKEIKENFPKINYRFDNLSWKMQLLALKTYTAIVGDIIPPVLEGI